MKRALLIMWLASCGKSESAPSPSAKPPPPMPGRAHVNVNADRMAKIKDTIGPVRTMEPWDVSYAHLTAEFGKPTNIGVNDLGVKVYSWAALRDDECFAFDVEQRDGVEIGEKPGKIVGDVSHVYPYPYLEPTKQDRMACLVAAGLAPAEDPNAPGPRGKSAKIGEIATNAVRARSKWTNKELVVTGTVTKVSTHDRDTVLTLAEPTDSSKTLDATLDRSAVIAKVDTRATYTCEVIASFTPDDAAMPTGVSVRLTFCR